MGATESCQGECLDSGQVASAITQTPPARGDGSQPQRHWLAPTSPPWCVEARGDPE